MSRIAIIGAGIGGITMARELAKTHEVVVFEQSRGVGGRMATRHVEGFSVDHGAQYFTMRHPRFAAMVEPLLASGAVAPWLGQIARIDREGLVTLGTGRDIHYVGVPHMNSFAGALAAGLDVRRNTTVAPLGQRQPQGWMLQATDGTTLGLFDWVISSTTPHQTVALWGEHAPTSGALVSARMQPCYALMLGFGRAVKRDWVLARFADSAVDLVSINSSKPGRDVQAGTLVVHSTSAWAAAHLDMEVHCIQAELERAAAAAIWIDPAATQYRQLHRWKSARLATGPAGSPYLDRARGLAASGDWASGSRVEDVALSALDLADMLLADATVG